MLWLAPALPLLGFLILGLVGRRARPVAGLVGVSAVLPAFVVVLVAWLREPAVSRLGPWFSVGELTIDATLRLDGLSGAFALVITGVGALIHLYAADYMRDDPDRARFFAWMNLFVAAMLLLVLADDLLLLYAGWEGVGLCSYGLIGFWYREPANGRAARKAFVVTRAGDAVFLLGLLTIATTLGTLRISDVLALAPAVWGPSMATLATMLLLAGAVGKSAQLPLHVWLPDAMAGPTPTSALIHAATMVTAGVYLIARTFPLFALSPVALDVVAWLGAASMIVGALAALGQRDLKRMLAYSTMSQVGLMFVALGAGSVAGAVFHFAVHAFFKALLFLCAGVIILAMHHDQDMTRMGGLWRRMPLTFGAFLVGAAALAGLPFVTAGFYSKEAVLAATEHASPWLFWLTLLGSLLTALYVFRAVFLVFFGELQQEPEGRRGWQAAAPMIVLAGLTLVAGYFSGHLELDPLTVVLASIAAFVGLAGGWLLRGWAAPRALEAGLGFDALYERAIVRPFVGGSRWNRSDRIDDLFRGIAAAAVGGSSALGRTQTGRVRSYLAAAAAGAVLLLALALWGTP